MCQHSNVNLFRSRRLQHKTFRQSIFLRIRVTPSEILWINNSYRKVLHPNVISYMLRARFVYMYMAPCPYTVLYCIQLIREWKLKRWKKKLYTRLVCVCKHFKMCVISDFGVDIASNTLSFHTKSLTYSMASFEQRCYWSFGRLPNTKFHNFSEFSVCNFMWNILVNTANKIEILRYARPESTIAFIESHKNIEQTPIFFKENWWWTENICGNPKRIKV